MNNKIKNIFIFLVSFSIFSQYLITSQQEIPDQSNQSPFILPDTISNEDVTEEYDLDFDDLSTNENIDLSKTRGCEPGEINNLTLMITTIQGQNLFDKEFYTRTNTPNYREINSDPSIFTFNSKLNSKSRLSFDLLFNNFTTKNFTENNKYNGQRLRSYIDLDVGSLLKKIEDNKQVIINAIPNLSPLFDINIPTIFDSLTNSRLEERRLSLFSRYSKEILSNVTFEATIPIIYQIKNINYDDADQIKIGEEFGNAESKFNTASTGNENDVLAFAKKHIIMDAIGIGTIELNLSRTLKKYNKLNIDGSISLKLPTDTRIIKGLYGTYFEPTDQQNVIRFCDIVNITNKTFETGGKELLLNYAISALDHLSSAILQCPMGNDHHFSITVSVAPTYQLKENLKLYGKASIEYLLPAEESRFFIKNKPSILFSTEYNNAANNNIRIKMIEEKMTERLFPRVFKSKVSPGFISNNSANIEFNLKKWDFRAGLNIWGKTSESISDLKTITDKATDYNIDKATKKYAWQVKINGALERGVTFRSKKASLSLFGNITVFNRNLGNDFTIGLNFNKQF